MASKINIGVTLAGPAGPAGASGTATNGLPTGGAINQALLKSGSSDFVAAWTTIPLFSTNNAWTGRQTLGSTTVGGQTDVTISTAGRAIYAKTTSVTDHSITTYMANGAANGTPFSGGANSSALNIASDNYNNSAVFLSGVEKNRGTLKIAHKGFADGSDSSAAAISIDLQTQFDGSNAAFVGTGTKAQGIFITSTTDIGSAGIGGAPLTVRVTTGLDDVIIKGNGYLQLGAAIASTAQARLDIRQPSTGQAIFLQQASGNTGDVLIAKDSGGTTRLRIDQNLNIVSQRTVYSVIGVQVGGTSTTFGSGSGILGLTDATTAPTTTPTGGIAVYSSAGILKYRSSNGTTYQLDTTGTNTGDQDLSGLVPKTTTVNGHALSGNVTVTETDVLPSQTGNSGKVLQTNGTATSWVTPASGGGGSGTVTSVAVTTANGVSGSVANSTTTPAITLSLGAITPTSVAASGSVTGSNLSGTNTGDQDLTNYTTKDDIIASTYNPNFGPGDHGMKTWSFDPSMAVNNSAPTAGTAYVTRVKFGKATTITSLYYVVGTAGGTVANAYIALYQGGTLLAQSSDISSTLATTGNKTATISSTAVAAGYAQIVFWVGSATTMPAFARGASSAGQNFNLATTTLRYSTANTGLTTTAPGTLGTQTTSNIAFWVGAN